MKQIKTTYSQNLNTDSVEPSSSGNIIEKEMGSVDSDNANFDSNNPRNAAAGRTCRPAHPQA